MFFAMSRFPNIDGASGIPTCWQSMSIGGGTYQEGRPLDIRSLPPTGWKSEKYKYHAYKFFTNGAHGKFHAYIRNPMRWNSRLEFTSWRQSRQAHLKYRKLCFGWKEIKRKKQNAEITSVVNAYGDTEQVYLGKPHPNTMRYARKSGYIS